MIAEVIPLIRLPRRFTFFDYAISELDVHVGDIVSVTFKNREILGVVRGLRQKSEYKIQNILSVVEPEFLNSDDIKRLETIATNIIQSPSTILYTALYGFRNKKDLLKADGINYPKLMIEKDIIEQVSKVTLALKKTDRLFLQTGAEGATTTAYALAKKFKNQILILVPHERDVKVIHKQINFKSKTAALHGKVPASQRNAILRSWKSGDIRVLISTRQGSLLPANKIDAIIVFNSESIDHKNWDRNPRYDARLAVKLLAKQQNAKLIFTGPLPRTKDLFEKQIIVWASNMVPDPTVPDPIKTLVNLSAREESSGIPMISDTLKIQIAETISLNKQALLIYNRKGVAKRLQCTDCKQIPFCGTCGANPVVRADDLLCPVCKTEMWIPKNCPTCGSEKLKPRGIGNKRIKAELQKAFPGKSVSIIDKQNIENINADILIVTEYFFQAIHVPFMKKRFGIVADLCIDLSIGSEFDSSEMTASKLHRLLMLAEQQKAKCLIQTWIPDTIKEMLNSKQFLASELDIRSKYKLFPVFESISKRDPGKKPEDVVRFFTVDLEKKKSLTTVPNSCIIDTQLRNYET